jgi:hypothetical protein
VVTVAAVAALVACEHPQPFGAPDLGANVPFSLDFPRQLTFSEGGDLAPAWLPDGSGILYSFQRFDRADHDRCLGVLPAEGGHLVRTICHRGLLDPDSTNALWEPAVGPAGLLAYVRESAVPGSLAPNAREIVLATLELPDSGRVVQALPATAPDGTLFAFAADLRWVSATTLVFLAEQVAYTTPPNPTDTMFLPVEILRLDIGGAAPALASMPGTSGATSLDVDSAGALYYTLAGDPRVYRLATAAATPQTVYDFGSAGPAGDVRVAPGRLVALAGAVPYRVDPATGSATAINVPVGLVVRRLALSPAGTRLVAETRGAFGGQANLWLMEVP